MKFIEWVYLRNTLFIILLAALWSCKSSEKFSGFSYDPKGSSETKTKPVYPQHKRTIGITKNGIWVSNEFAGARLNDFYRKNDTLYQAIIKPENAPINHSPWYAFKIWADVDTTVWLELSYKHGEHRYKPKLSTNGTSWTPIKPRNYRPDKKNGTAYLRLHLHRKPLWVSAQELRTQHWFDQWADSIAQKSFITQDTVGYSHQHRPIRRMRITSVPENQNRGIIIIIGRLHPPEVTGTMACVAFIEALASDTKLARQFRQKFEVIAYPFANPDGVQNGHWRHNNGGVDLNRDWHSFYQPETDAIRKDLLARLKDTSRMKVYYGLDFHSTDENIFYPINRNVNTFPDDFTYQWIDPLIRSFPDTHFSIEPFNTRAPIAKNWIYHTFGADAVTYEVDDAADRKKLKAISKKAAQLIMQQLLRAKQNHNRPVKSGKLGLD